MTDSIMCDHCNKEIGPLMDYGIVLPDGTIQIIETISDCEEEAIYYFCDRKCLQGLNKSNGGSNENKS